MDQAAVRNYVRKALALGANQETIKENLVKNGLTEKEALALIIELKTGAASSGESVGLISSLSKGRAKLLGPLARRRGFLKKGSFSEMSPPTVFQNVLSVLIIFILLVFLLGLAFLFLREAGYLEKLGFF